jgi:hypothetical protein
MTTEGWAPPLDFGEILLLLDRRKNELSATQTKVERKRDQRILAAKKFERVSGAIAINGTKTSATADNTQPDDKTRSLFLVVDIKC